jgi:acyl-CoA synthetase (NDP forming)
MTVYSDLEKAFNPETVAIVGVSSTNELHRDYSGLKFLKNLKSSGFKGRIYPIKRRQKRSRALKFIPACYQFRNIWIW